MLSDMFHLDNSSGPDWTTWTTLLATALGFVLAESANWLRTRREQNRQIRATRTMLRVEVTSNTDQLQNLLTQITKPLHGEQLRAYGKMLGFARSAFPPWSATVWQSQLPALPSALTIEEIERLYKFYRQLESFEALRRKLAEDVVKDDAELAANPGAVDLSRLELPRHEWQWSTWEREMRNTLAEGRALTSLPSRRPTFLDRCVGEPVRAYWAGLGRDLRNEESEESVAPH